MAIDAFFIVHNLALKLVFALTPRRFAFLVCEQVDRIFTFFIWAARGAA